MKRVTYACTCGAYMAGGARFVDAWRRIWHTGPGHEPTDAKMAAAVRRRREQAAIRGEEEWEHGDREADG